MEDTRKQTYVNILDKEFVNKNHENPDYKSIGMKSVHALWGSLPSFDEDLFYSEWDERYDVVDQYLSEGKDVYITTFQYGDNTAIISPYEIGYPILHAFYETVKDSNESDVDIRKLFVEFLKSKELIPENVEYVVCQVDLIEDLEIIQKAFAGYDMNSDNDPEVYESFNYKIMKGITKCFSGLEFTGYALGEGNVFEYEMVALENDPKYMEDENSTHIGDWEVQSVSIFDTNCIKVINTKKISNPDVKKR